MGLVQRMRGRVLAIRLSMFRRIPPHVRGRLVTRFTGWLAPAEMRWASKKAWWDGVFASEDPFFFDSNPREALKYERTLALCGAGPFARALEIGCAEGAFTERLAPRCRKLDALDISAVAVQRAADRTRSLPGVSCERRTLPVEFEKEAFDLIVASDVLYYLSVSDLEAALSAFERALAPGGGLVFVHYAPPMGAMLDGDEVHDALESLLTLEHTHAERVLLDGARYRFDRFDRRARRT